MKLPYRLPNASPHSASGLWLWGIAVEVATIVFASWVATEYIAYRFRFDPRLGEPLVQGGGIVAGMVVMSTAYATVATWKTRKGIACLIGGLCLGSAVSFLMPIYAPWLFWVWLWYYWSTPGTEDWWVNGLDMLMIAHLAPALSIGLQVARSRQFGGETDLHGSARFALPEEIAQAGLLEDEGVYVGAVEEGDTLRYLRDNSDTHDVIVAPTRGGKGVGVVIPTLVSWSHSVLVNDIKEELWEHSAGWRSRVLKSRCIKFDPTCRDGSGARYNLMLDIRAWPDDVRDVQLLSHELAPTDPKESKHWNLTARSFLDGVILHQLYVGKNKSLAGCYRRLTDPTRKQEQVLEEMMMTVHDSTGKYGWEDPETGEATLTHPVVSSAMRAVLNMSDRERSSVISSAISHFEIYQDPWVAGNTSASDFSLHELATGTEHISLYLVIPPSDIDRLAPLRRMMFAMFTQRLAEKLNATKGKANRRILFMVDERTSLGKVKIFSSDIAWLAGYGLKCCFVLQAIEQLREIEEPGLIGKCHIRVFFAPLDLETAEMMSQMLGERTVLKAQRTYTGGRFTPLLTHVIASEQESKRSLLTPAEVLRMDADREMIFVGNSAPIDARRIKYFEDPEFSARAEIPPPARSDVLPPKAHPWTYVAMPITNGTPVSDVENLL